MNQNKTQDLEFQATLKALLNTMLPINDIYKMPSGADVGFEMTLSPTDVEWIQPEFLKLNSGSFGRFGKVFHLTDTSEQIATVEIMKSALRPFFSRLLKRLLEFYYQRPEVRNRIGFRQGPPFPEGYPVDEGDFTLLESVYEGPKKYRET